MKNANYRRDQLERVRDLSVPPLFLLRNSSSMGRKRSIVDALKLVPTVEQETIRQYIESQG